MRFSYIIRLCVTFAVLLAAVSANAGKTYKNPVIDNSMPDPTVIKGDDGYYYVFTTVSRAHNMQAPIYKSKDLVNWEFANYIFTPDQKPQDLPGGDLWAPDVIKYKGKYLLAYALSANGEKQRNGIGLGISDTPEGPYKNLGLLFTSESCGVTNSIDPSLIEEDGKLYLLWGSFYGIYITEIQEDKNGHFRIADLSKKKQIAGDAFEGCHIFKRNGYYYLFASTGTCCSGEKSTYRLVVGRSKNLMGPYTDYDGVDMLKNGYNFMMGGNNYYVGPGHGSKVITDNDGKTWYLYHAYKRSEINKGRLLMLDEIRWTSDGWPYIYRGSPSVFATPAPNL